MVQEGRRKPPSAKLNLKSPCSLIKKIASLQRKPEKDKALEILHKVAVEVAPILRENNLKVGILCEFFPSDKNLLGLNVNRGQKVLVRLRSPYNEYQFLSYGDILGTTLHELVHNTHGPHNQLFYDMLKKYKDRHYEIQMKSAFAATGYFSLAEKVGGRSIDPTRARISKLGPTKGYKSESKRLGGSSVPRKGTRPTRELILQALEKRARDMKWCAEEHSKAADCEPNESDLDVMIVDEIELDGEENVIKKEDTEKEKKEEPKRKKSSSKKSLVKPNSDAIEIIDLT